MGEKDIAEKNFMSLNDVFADIIDVLIFKGKGVMNEESLEDRRIYSQYKADDEVLHEQERDVFKKWKGCGINLVLFGIENQTDIDTDMPFRVIGYDGAAYRSQLSEEKYGKPSKERSPIITIVLYFGKKPWNCSNRLKDCFVPSLPDNEASRLLSEYISDYRINVIDVPRLPKKTVKCFKSDFRIVAEYFVNVYTNPEYTPLRRELKHVDGFMKLMKVLTKDERYLEVVDKIKGKNGGGVDMCNVLDYHENKGRAEGRAEALASLVKDGLLTKEEAAKRADMSLVDFEKFLT